MFGDVGLCDLVFFVCVCCCGFGCCGCVVLGFVCCLCFCLFIFVWGCFLMGVSLVCVDDVMLFFEVGSSSRGGVVHDVMCSLELGWVCSCEHFFFRKVECKHIRVCKEWLLRDKGFCVVGVSAFGVVCFDDVLVGFVCGLPVYG